MSALLHIQPTGKTAGIEMIRASERNLSRMLVAYISAGLAFMLLPGTFLGVWNLLRISSQSRIPASWIQAHGHAQVFGWVGTFILGIGFYSIPKLRRSNSVAVMSAWLCFAFWTAGVATRWYANIYSDQWRVLLPVSAVLELAAYLIFLRAVSGHKPANTSQAKRNGFEHWIVVVMIGSCGLLAVLIATLIGTVLAARSASPAFPADFDAKYLVFCGWLFLVPFVSGFSAKWLPVFLGLKPTRTKLLLLLIALSAGACGLELLGMRRSGAMMLAAIAVSLPISLRLFEAPVQAPKLSGVHPSYPIFIRLAYVWLIVASALGVWASFGDPSGGIGGASRHALTVGFVSSMIFAIGQRVLPAFSGMRLLYSKKLMFCCLLLLNLGCAMRVTSETLAYPGYAERAWRVLPISAVTELLAVTIFAWNLYATFVRPAAVEAEGSVDVRLNWSARSTDSGIGRRSLLSISPNWIVARPRSRCHA